MNGRLIPRHNRASGARRAFGLLMLVSFNLAMSPCAMAAKKDYVCPGCPPGHEQETASKHSHNEATGSPSCATSQADCCEIDQGNFDDRSQKLVKKDNAKSAHLVAPVIAEVCALSMRHVFNFADPPDLVSGSPRIHIMNCVYLD